jgi:hypothetical protein
MQRKLIMLSNRSKFKKTRYKQPEKPESASCQHLKGNKCQYAVREYVVVEALMKLC